MPVDSTFEAVIFDWDGTAVVDRQSDARYLARQVESLCAAGVHLFVVSGTHVGNIDRQLAARPAGPGSLHLAVNRGSQIFEVAATEPTLVWERTATDSENEALDRAADLALQRLRGAGIEARPVSGRLNRRKIDVLPDPEWDDPPKARIAELLAAVTVRLEAAAMTLVGVIELARQSALDAGLVEPRITTDVKHVEIGLTDKSDSARWAIEWLRERGITGRLILAAGDEFGPLGGVPGSDSLMLVPDLARAEVVSVGVEPGRAPAGVLHLGGGPAQFLQLLDGQLLRRRHRRVPSIDDDPAWTILLPEARRMERAAEAIGTLSNGWIGTRAAKEESGPVTGPLVVVEGVYTGGESPNLLPGPWWAGVRLRARGTGDHRLLDLRTGVLARSSVAASVRTVRFVSAATPSAMALRAEGPVDVLDGGSDLAGPADDVGFERGHRVGLQLARTFDVAGTESIAVVARDWQRRVDHVRVFERITAWSAGASEAVSDAALEGVTVAAAIGFDRLLAEHRAAWARRWSNAEVTIDDNRDDELAARFAVFHLLSAAADSGEAAVGARGLTGPAYGGHVFWDADVFVLPALAALHPAAARAMLEYRVRRLPAARAAAASMGRRGARFPWESAGQGSDVTPRMVKGARGRPTPVRTGRHEEHIVADVAWAAMEYVAWTGDDDFLSGAGRDLLLDTARYWASHACREDDGHAHIYGVMGPDEYHEVVDDNAYTNVMARWNLRTAAELLVSTGGDSTEASRWRALADTLVDGYDSGRGLYEQFAGYWTLEPLLIAHVAPPPVAADLLLGHDRVAGSQLIKQADVLMLHHLVPDEVADGSLGSNLHFYEPRTAHGSSLSPAIHAALLARAGEPDHALELFRMAARLDLDDLTGTTAGGLHLATMGGLWQALAYGFLGLRPQREVLDVDPCLPRTWPSLALRLRFRGTPIQVRAEHDSVTIQCDSPVIVRIEGGAGRVVAPPGATIRLRRCRR